MGAVPLAPQADPPCDGKSRRAEFLEALGGAASSGREVGGVAVVVAHPDDEVIGLGSRLARFARPLLVYVTDGAPRDGGDARARGFGSCEGYAAARRRERDAALNAAGVHDGRIVELGCPDQGVCERLADLACRLALLFDGVSLRWVVTHPYEGGHPDHDGTAFAVHAACGLLRAGGADPPEIVEMTSYHLGTRGLEPGCFLSHGQGADDGTSTEVRLAPSECAAKQRSLDCFGTQQDTLRYFTVGVERFRPAPRYDFARPPHDGPLFYEQHPWGMTGSRFCDLARAALGELGLAGAP